MDKMSQYRVLIVDVSHLFYKFAFGGVPRLTTTINVGGVDTIVDTTLPAMTLKVLHRWARKGSNPLIVCFDGEGCTRSRKAYFKTGTAGGGVQVGYKESRTFQDDNFYRGINMTYSVLKGGGALALKVAGYEADDLVAAAVRKAKIEYPDIPIDIVTGDQDLLPLVDEQVSVFLTSRKTTSALFPDIEKRGYVQITPTNYASYVESLTEFKGLQVPYNTVLLKKLLRGKKADDIPGYPKFTPTKYNKLINQLLSDGYDLHTLFRYDAPPATLCYRSTQEPIPHDLIESTPKEQKMLKFGEPETLTTMCEVLGQYLDEDVISHIRFVYNGINLNCAYTRVPDTFKRRPAVINSGISGYSCSDMQKEAGKLKIELAY